MNAPAAALPLLFLGSLFAQSLPRGASAAWDAAFVFDTPDTEVFLKGKNLPMHLTHIPLVQGASDYAARTIASWLSSASSKPLAKVAIDGFTTMNDNLAVGRVGNEYRISVQGPIGWTSLFVARDGLDVVGFYFENPSFPPLMRNVRYQELAPGDFLTSGSPVGSTNNIMAMDFAMPRILENRGLPEEGAFSITNTLLFTLTPASAREVDNLGLFTSRIDGATILRATYVNGGIHSIAVELTGAQLGLAPDTNIDALAAFVVPGPPPPADVPLVAQSTAYIFSTEPGQDAEELMMFASTSPGVMVKLPLHSPDGLPLIGPPPALLPGHAKGVCGEDPEVVSVNRIFGVPTNDPYPVWPRMSFSLWQYKDDMLHDRLHGILSGWTATTGTQAVELWMQTPSGALTYFSLPDLASNSGYYSFDMVAPVVPLGTECKFMVLIRPIPVNWNALPNCSITVGLER